jgi:NAD(P)-dependent dehydrogenase (short-subunit alcohol dehydrogenase family)
MSRYKLAEMQMMNNRYVLVTGASTGIGYASAVALAEKGFHVFAGVRNPADAERIRLQSGGRLEPVILDVTKPEQIADVEAHIESVVGGAGLHGLINNAGIVVAGPLEFLPIEDFQRQWEINVKGLMAVTQAFLPLLRANSGRLCLVSSNSGYLSTPFMGAYCASKFAVEALGDALRVELATWNIRVSLIEPGATATPIWEKSKVTNEAILARMPAECMELYAKEIALLRTEADKMAKTAAPVKTVTDCVVHSLTAANPKTRYRCAKGATLAWIAARWLPDKLRDKIILKAMAMMG